MTTLRLCALAAAALLQAPPAVTDLDGHRVDPLRAEPGVRATALIFTSTGCPIANQAAPEIERVRTQFSIHGVRLWLVYVDPSEGADAIRSHVRAYGLGAPAVRDPLHELVRLTGVRVTPEAAVYLHEASGPRLIYRGRLDDRVPALGSARTRATRFDLRVAIADALDSPNPSLITTPAVGCVIADLR